MTRLLPPLCLVVLSLSACSTATKEKPVVYSAGDQATVGQLVYKLTDAIRTPQIGASRNAKDRFYLIKVSAFNKGAQDQSVPGMALVDDSGQIYPELNDGAGVPSWLGVVRTVRPAQTDQGFVIFDAPAKHYRLRINDQLDSNEISFDLPVNFVRDLPNGEIPGSAGR